MNIHVETNFVLELVFEQEQAASCEAILVLCEQKRARLVIPAYSLVEPHEKMRRQARNREELQRALNLELDQLARSTNYSSRIGNISAVKSLLADSNEEETNRFSFYRNRLLQTADVVDLTPSILNSATRYEDALGLGAQDAIVYSSVIQDLQIHPGESACFLNRNSKDFGIPDIKTELDDLNCRLIWQFTQGLDFIRAQLTN